MLTIQEVATKTGLPVAFIERAIRRGLLTTSPNDPTLILAEDLEDYLDRRDAGNAFVREVLAGRDIVDEAARDRGAVLDDTDIAELDAIWDEATPNLVLTAWTT